MARIGRSIPVVGATVTRGLVVGVETYTATAAVTVGAATASGSAKFPFSATSAVTVGAATASGSAKFPFSATAAVTVGAATASATGTVVNPTYSATAAVTVGAATASGSAKFPFSATSAVTVGAATASGSATFTAAAGTFTGTGAATAGAATASGSATFTAAPVESSSSSGGSSVAGLVWGPVRPSHRIWRPQPVTATLAATCPAATASGTATFTPPRRKFSSANFVLLGLLGLPELADHPDLAAVFFDD